MHVTNVIKFVKNEYDNNLTKINGYEFCIITIIKLILRVHPFVLKKILSFNFLFLQLKKERCESKCVIISNA